MAPSSDDIVHTADVAPELISSPAAMPSALKPQRRQLDQQPVSPAAQRAASIEGIQARIARTNLHQAEMDRQYKDELRWMQKEVDHLKAELDVSRRRRTEADEEIAGLKSQLEAARKEMSAAQLEVTEARARVEAARKDGLRAEVERLRADLDAARKAAAQANLDLVEAQRMAEGVTKELRAIQAESAARDAKLEAAAAEAQLATAEMEALQERVLQLSVAQQQSESELMQTRAELAKAQNNLEVAVHEAAQLRNDVKAKANELTTVQQHLAAAEAVQAEMQGAKEEAIHRAAMALAELEEVKQSVSSTAALQMKLSRMESELNDLQSQYRSMTFEHAKSRAEHAEMSGKMLKAQEETARYMSFYEEVVSALRQQLGGLNAEPVAVPEPPPLPSHVRHHCQSGSWGSGVSAILAGLNSNRRISLGSSQNSGGGLSTE
ncbi:hypothetical protein VaNZ11_000369 [Volvox africanus]|uniref:Uncharacterized protein n=1 Tax=Volvox africanus TaxID=51714 RepID=A0ABQ5RN71_9CHLO|nr:hypothetical protein VaNZ11_000369 [Volvox africanus]